jgi:hypothetical protein
MAFLAAALSLPLLTGDHQAGELVLDAGNTNDIGAYNVTRCCNNSFAVE